MSGAVPPISPATGGAIYEATAKAEKAHAEAEQLADEEVAEGKYASYLWDQLLVTLPCNQ